MPIISSPTSQQINLEFCAVSIGQQVVTVRGGQHGSHAVLRQMGESDGAALRRALPAFTYKRLKKELSDLADDLDGIKRKPSPPRNTPRQEVTGWGTLSASPGVFR